MTDKKKDKQPSGIVEKKITEHLEYKFTPDELRDLSGELARFVKELNQAELRKKDVSSQLTADINAIQTKVTAHAIKVGDGTEYRDIKCSVTYDFNRGQISVARDDTGETVRDREMTDDQRQQSFLDSLTD